MTIEELQLILREHRHDDITSRKNIKSPIVLTINLSLPADMIDKNIFIADRAYKIKNIKEAHTTAETTAGTLTLDITRCTGTTAPTSGIAVLGTGFDMKASANTVQTDEIVSTGNVLATGDRLALDFSAGATELAGVSITIVLETLKA